MNDEIGLALKDHLSRCYTLSSIPKNPPDFLLQPLQQHRTLILSDIELRLDDFSPLQRFLASKQAINWLDCIILNKTSAKTKRSRKIALFKNGNYSAFTLEGCRMLRVVIEFISKSVCLQHIVIDSINVSPIIVASLGGALTEHRQGLKSLKLQNVPLGDEGLRLLAPHLSKCKIQSLTFQKCQLTDGCLPFLSSILKSQEAIQENNFWNSTLRSYPGESAQRMKENSSHSHNTGLVIVDLSHNKLSTRGAIALAHLLSENKWILGLNLSNNRIEEKGVDRLLHDILSPDQIESALICLHIRGNPGCDERILETLSLVATNNLRHPIFSHDTNAEVIQTLLKWLNDQKEMKLLPKKGTSRKDSHRSPQSDMLGASNELLVPTIHLNGFRDEVVEEEGYDNNDIVYNALNHSHNGTEDQYIRDDQHQRSDFVSSDVLSLQSDDRILSSQPVNQSHNRYSQDNLADSFEFDGYSPTHKVEYNDINGRPPSRASIRPRHMHISDARPPSRQEIRRPVQMSQQSLSNIPEVNHRASRYSTVDDIHLAARGRSSQKPQKSSKRSQSADPLARQGAQRASYMNPTRSFRSYLKTVNHDHYADIVDLHLRSSEHYQTSLRTSQESRGRKTEPYPKQRTRKLYSPPPKKRQNESRRRTKSRTTGDDKRIIPKRKKSPARRTKVTSSDTEALIHKLGEGVMTELSKVVDTVSNDLKLVTEQLKNLSTSMNESMLMSSFVKDHDLSTTNSGAQVRNVIPPPTSPVRLAHESDIGRKSPERLSRDTRYNSSDQQSHSDSDSQLIDSKVNEDTEDDEALTEMIRSGLKQKLLGLISQNMLLTR